MSFRRRRRQDILIDSLITDDCFEWLRSSPIPTRNLSIIWDPTALVVVLYAQVDRLWERWSHLLLSLYSLLSCRPVERQNLSFLPCHQLFPSLSVHLRLGKVLDLGEFCVSSTRADRSADVCYPDEGQRASFKRSVGRQINRQLEVHLHSWYQNTRWLLYTFLPDCKAFPPNVADVQTRFSKRLCKQNILYKNNRVLQVLVVRVLFHITEQCSYPMIRGIFRCESPADQFCNMPSWLLPISLGPPMAIWIDSWRTCRLINLFKSLLSDWVCSLL